MGRRHRHLGLRAAHREGHAGAARPQRGPLRLRLHHLRLQGHEPVRHRRELAGGHRGGREDGGRSPSTTAPSRPCARRPPRPPCPAASPSSAPDSSSAPETRRTASPTGRCAWRAAARCSRPAMATDPVQFIDVRDLAAWTSSAGGAPGPRHLQRHGPRDAAHHGRDARGLQEGHRQRRAPSPGRTPSFLEQQKVMPWSDMPVWIPRSGEDKGMGRISNARALKLGLTFRPAGGHRARHAGLVPAPQPPERQQKLRRAGLTPEREREVLAAWHQSAPGPEKARGMPRSRGTPLAIPDSGPALPLR